MSALKILIFFTVAIFSAFSQTTVKPPENYNYEPAFIEAAHEFVRLHLVREFSRTKELVKTSEGRNWLRVWDSIRTSILYMIIIEDSNTKVRMFYKNWRERLQHFQKLQTDYLQHIVKNHYDKRRESSPWPKITFDSKTHRTTFDPQPNEFVNQNEHESANPISTVKDVDEVMQYHRPFEENESGYRQKLPDNVKDSGSMNAKKKYYFINQKIIKNLHKVYYTLMRESLMGKRMSDLDYQAAVFHGERIVAEIDNWTMAALYYENNYELNSFDLFIPAHLRVLKNDLIYRKYLNYDESFYGGNCYYGYKNRYDDPEKFGLDFDVTAESIISYYRYQPLFILVKNVQEFGITSNNYVKKYELNDLPLISFYLERFKVLTFWYSQGHFKQSQWFTTKSPTSMEEVTLAIPKFHKLKSKGDMFKEVEATLLEAKKQVIKPSTLSDVMLELNHNLEEQIKLEVLYLKKKKGIEVRFMHTLVNRVMSYVNSLNQVNLLSFLTMKPDDKLSAQLLLRISLEEKKANKQDNERTSKKHNENKVNENANHDFYDSNKDSLSVKETVVDTYNEDINLLDINDLFNPYSNSLIHQEDQFSGFYDTYMNSDSSDVNKIKPYQFGTGGDGENGNNSNLKRTISKSENENGNHKHKKLGYH